MPPLAPVITPVADLTAPVAVDTKVADLAQPAEETDPGPFTYAVVTGAESVQVAGAQLTALIELSADVAVSVTATSDPGGVSPEGTGTISIAAAPEPPGPAEPTDDYPGNPNLPPKLENPDDAWQYFIVAATNALVPRARNGVDFKVARASKYDPLTNVAWDDTLLGPRPDAEIEAEARRLAAEWPSGVTPV